MHRKLECRLESISNHRWLGEIIHGRVVAARVDADYQAMEPREPAETHAPLYHHTYDHINGVYYSVGEPILDEVKGR